CSAPPRHLPSPPPRPSSYLPYILIFLPFNFFAFVLQVFFFFLFFFFFFFFFFFLFFFFFFFLKK
ncbi:hypothetical protein DUI37_28560, partial [Bacillus anthracis]